MSEQVAHRFIEALRRLESDRDIDSMVAIFSDNCTVSNVVVEQGFKGRDGARQFWTQYRDTFGQVSSTFKNTIIGEGRAALEWTTEGTSQQGNAINYEGVSILEFEGDRITRFHAYFDPNKISHQVVKEARA